MSVPDFHEMFERIRLQRCFARWWYAAMVQAVCDAQSPETPYDVYGLPPREMKY